MRYASIQPWTTTAVSMKHRQCTRRDTRKQQTSKFLWSVLDRPTSAHVLNGSPYSVSLYDLKWCMFAKWRLHFMLLLAWAKRFIQPLDQTLLRP